MQELKFELTNETKVNAWGVTLFRIKAKVSFKNVKKGDLGGWVESERLSNGNARVSGNAWVYGDARVSGDARVYGNAQVYGNAEVYGNARVSGDARVYGDARVSGNAEVYGNARVSGDARVYGDARVSGNAEVYGNAWVSLRKAYTKGNFLYTGDNTIKPVIIDQSNEEGFDSSDDYNYLLVVGDYEISDIDPPKEKNTVNIGGTEYEVTPELTEALAKLKKAE